MVPRLLLAPYFILLAILASLLNRINKTCDDDDDSSFHLHRLMDEYIHPSNKIISSSAPSMIAVYGSRSGGTAA